MYVGSMPDLTALKDGLAGSAELLVGDDHAPRRSREEMTHGGSSALSPEAERLRRAMGERGGWHADPLCAAVGLSAAEVACALVELELAGEARNTADGYQRCA